LQIIGKYPGHITGGNTYKEYRKQVSVWSLSSPNMTKRANPPLIAIDESFFSNIVIYPILVEWLLGFRVGVHQFLPHITTLAF